MLLSSVAQRIAPGSMDLYHSLLIVTWAPLFFVEVYAFRTNLTNIRFVRKA